MAYTKNTWQIGDVVTADKLNNMESGIAGASLKVGVDALTGALDKTAKEIVSVGHSGVVVLEIPEDGNFSYGYYSATAIMIDGSHQGEILVKFFAPEFGQSIPFYAATENDYPVVDMDGGGGGGGGISDVPVE